MDLKFRKYHGAGNDFIMADNREIKWYPSAEEAAFLCDRHIGIGADGLILLEDSDEGDFFMRYFNSDGRESSMCGNGGRCIIAFARSAGFTGATFHFKAIDGMHEATVTGTEGNITLVRLKMKDVKIPVKQDPDGYFLDTGSPHLVKMVADPDSVNVVAEGRKIRNNARYPEGTNVDFCRMDEGHLYVRTYERGVEDETLSCGTGVTASALAAAILSSAEGGVYRVDTHGGILQVSYRREQGMFTDIMLEGPAEFVFEGNIKI